MALAKLLGSDTLVGKSGNVPTSSIEGKSLMIYFSAHWCGPCRQFTPMLANWYKQMKAKGGNDFEIVFISGDRSQAEFEGYYKESHPWLTLPWGGAEEAKNRQSINKKFKVKGIPTLVVVDKDGSTCTTEGTRWVQMDPEGKNFPWKPKSIYEILSTTEMTRKDGSAIKVDDLKQLDNFALYFSASWCPPCRAFTPVLGQTYGKLQAAGKKTEFIYVPSDKDFDTYSSYYGSMPWATLVFGQSSVGALKQTCEVQGIPTLVTINGADGSIINNGARAAAGADPEGAEFPWPKKPLPACSAFDPRNDGIIDALNEDACVILNIEGVANKDTSIIEFQKAAEQYAAKFKKEGEEEEYPVHFFIAGQTAESSELYGRVLQALGAAPAKPGVATVMALHLANDRAKSTLSGEFAAQTVLDHVETFKKVHA